MEDQINRGTKTDELLSININLYVHCMILVCVYVYLYMYACILTYTHAQIHTYIEFSIKTDQSSVTSVLLREYIYSSILFSHSDGR